MNDTYFAIILVAYVAGIGTGIAIAPMLAKTTHKLVNTNWSKVWGEIKTEIREDLGQYSGNNDE